ncbi:HAMP domain-containing sensor histidine kinase [Pseudomonas sp. FH1]|uniref:sensor histidine kinase n=1 Tax=Pseudomonas sp. FH1 TaxID=1284392 RepID=UPI0003DDCEA5|nr:HAMP domain-containing sensor histidine kinase [Pseudomonas sp. FH1]ETK15074.1 sensory transduction protein kinase [Pseudomonas sp. FH1]
MLFPTDSFFTRILYTLLPFMALITGFYSLLIWLAVAVTEDYIVESYLNLEAEAFQGKHAQVGRAAPMPNAIYLKGYWSTDPTLPLVALNLPPGHHELAKGDVHVLVSAVGGESALLVLLLDESKLSQTEGYRTQIFGLLCAVAGLILILGAILAIAIARAIAQPVSQLAAEVADAVPGPVRFSGFDRQDEIGTLSRTLSSLVTQQHSTLQREKAFTRHVSHELRTPLSILNNCLAILRLPGCNAEKSARSLLRMEAALAGMKMTIELFLSLAREPRQLPHEAIDLAAVVAEQIEKYQLLYPHAAGARVFAGAPTITLANEAIARSVVQNLLGNAVQHGAGKIRVVLTEQHLVILNNRVDQLASPGFGFGLEIVSRACTHAGWRLETRRTLHTFRAHVRFT